MLRSRLLFCQGSMKMYAATSIPTKASDRRKSFTIDVRMYPFLEFVYHAHQHVRGPRNLQIE